MSEIEGIYVPALHKEKIIKKRIVSDINLCPIPEMPVVPLMKTIHDRITIEIARGCTRGCRFCQAGMVWRPVRERNQELIEKAADALLCTTGYSEISLLSLSSGDYSRIEKLLPVLMERYYEKRVALALPSLRVETLKKSLMENIRRVRKTSFTLAPEAGTQRLRDIINKGNTEEELLSSVRQVFEAGWKSVKLYFMIGLPDERVEDLEGIVDLAYKALDEGKKRGNITIALSSFVPKPHTPFQWKAQIDIKSIKEKQQFIKNRIRTKHISMKWHDARMSFLEGILSRGDENTGQLIEKAFRLGCRFDGWTDMFRFDLWEEALLETNVQAEYYLRERKRDEELPWDNIDCGVEKSYLLEEERKAIAGEYTSDCRFASCQECGVCDHNNIKVITASPVQVTFKADKDRDDIASLKNSRPDFQERHEKTIRLRFAKAKSARFLSHLELSEAFIRAIMRTDISFVYSQGFHPHPRISFSSATSVGMESIDEFADIRIVTDKPDVTVMEEINLFLPEGLKVQDIEAVTSKDESLNKNVRGFCYSIFLPAGMNHDISILREKIKYFLSADVFVIKRDTKGKIMEKNIRPLVHTIQLDEKNGSLTTAVKITPEGSVRPMEILTEILGIDKDIAIISRIVRTKTVFDVL
jgi:radical SAM-linked protein